MIKVIKEGKAPRGQVTCPDCHSVLDYGNADLQVDWEKKQNNGINWSCLNNDPMCLRCPVCGINVPAYKVSLPKEEIPQ